MQVSKGRMAQIDTSGADHPEKELTSKRGGIWTQQQQVGIMGETLMGKINKIRDYNQGYMKQADGVHTGQGL